MEKKQKRNVNPPIWNPTEPTTRYQNGEKKVPNHILFKLEFMMFVTNDADSPWMQMRNERAKIVPQNAEKESEKNIEMNVQHQLFVYLMHTGVMDLPRSSDSL